MSTSDSRKAFNFLKENIPQWTADLERITLRINEKRRARSRQSSNSGRSRIRSGSSASTITTGKQPTTDVTTPGANDGPFSQTATQATIGRPTQAAQSSTKRRETNTIRSTRSTGPARYRNQPKADVYYDGEIQKTFEQLVRNIGMGRNLLRKGKMAAKIEAMTEAVSNDDSSSSENDDQDSISPKIGYRPKRDLSYFDRSISRGGAFSGLRAVEASSDIFDTTDRALERAQGFCERGAHQFLRDGDCSPELQGCETHFKEASGLAVAEAERYRIKDEKTRLRRSLQEVAEAKIQEQRKSYHSTHEIDLEVDDSEEEIDEIDLAALRPPIRLTRQVL